jgi:predicted metal-dependent peptidase
MKFNQIIGSIPKEEIISAEKKMTDVLLEFGMNPLSDQGVTRLGGDPFIFSLIVPAIHIAKDSIKTAATDGKNFYWSPSFINAHSPLTFRFSCYHESVHSLLLHPQRINGRDKNLWNIAVDYIANGLIFDDLIFRKKSIDLFCKGFGDYLTVLECFNFYETGILPAHIGEETPFFYADPNIPKEEKAPEKIYERLKKACYHCFKCNSLHPKSQPDCNSSFHNLFDDHLEPTIKQDELSKKLSFAIEMTKSMSGNVSSFIIEELGRLSKPTLNLSSFLRMERSHIQAKSKNDWGRMKSRLLPFDLLLPKKKQNSASFICLLDTSASMTKEMMAKGVSQIISIDDRAEGILVCADAEIRWEKAIKLRSCRPSELEKIEIIGRGGTRLNSFFSEYEKQLKIKADLIIVISDGLLDQKDIDLMQKPRGAEIIWIIVGDAKFKEPFGKVFRLI